MTEPSIERMEDGLFARFGALTITTGGYDDGHHGVWWNICAPHSIGSGATRHEAIRTAWTAEVDRLHKALQALGVPVVVDSPSDTPAGPETAQEPVHGWRPMATCPRNAEAKLTEHVWVAYKDDVPRLWPPGLTVHPASETARGRLGWLPGHLNRSDLPPVVVTP